MTWLRIRSNFICRKVQTQSCGSRAFYVYLYIYIYIYDVHTRLSHTFICMLLLETGVGERGSRWGKMWESLMWGSRGWFELGEFGRSGWQQRPPSNNWTKTIDITTSFFQSVTRKHIVRSIPKAKFIKKIKLIHRVPQVWYRPSGSPWQCWL